MKKSFFLFLLASSLNNNLALAEKLTCPTSTIVKTAKFVSPIQDPYDREVWNFLSAPLSYGNRTWQISFGTFLPQAKTPQEALVLGQAFFDNNPLLNKNPSLVKIPHQILCDYMPEGRTYWVSALTPP